MAESDRHAALALGQVGDRTRAEHVLEGVLRLDPHRRRAATVEPLALPLRADRRREQTVERFDDLEHGDVLGRPGEEVAAADAPRRLRSTPARRNDEKSCSRNWSGMSRPSAMSVRRTGLPDRPRYARRAPPARAPHTCSWRRCSSSPLRSRSFAARRRQPALGSHSGKVDSFCQIRAAAGSLSTSGRGAAAPTTTPPLPEAASRRPPREAEADDPTWRSRRRRRTRGCLRRSRAPCSERRSSERPGGARGRGCAWRARSRRHHRRCRRGSRSSVGAATSSSMPSRRPTSRDQPRTMARNGRVPSKISSTIMIGTTMMKTLDSRLQEPCRKVRSRSLTRAVR